MNRKNSESEFAEWVMLFLGIAAFLMLCFAIIALPFMAIKSLADAPDPYVQVDSKIKDYKISYVRSTDTLWDTLDGSYYIYSFTTVDQPDVVYRWKRATMVFEKGADVSFKYDKDDNEVVSIASDVSTPTFIESRAGYGTKFLIEGGEQ